MVRWQKILLALCLLLCLPFVASAEEQTDVIDSSGQQTQTEVPSAPTLQEQEAQDEQEQQAQSQNGEEGLPEGVELDEDGNMVLSNGLKMTVQTPASLSGYKITVKDSAGNSITEKNISSSGTTELEMKNADNHPTIIINSGQIQARPEEEESAGVSMVDVALYAGAGATVSGLVFYFLGRRKGLKIIDELRDYIHEEKLD